MSFLILIHTLWAYFSKNFSQKIKMQYILFNWTMLQFIQLKSAWGMLGKPQLIQPRKTLKVPDNVILLFQPPYCPEVNPIERVWSYIKYRLRSQWSIDLDDVKDKVARILNSLSTDIIISLAGWEYFTTALSL